MKSCYRTTLIFTALIALSACGGGGTSGADGGTSAPTPGTNGLDFGATGQDLSDAEGRTVSMRSASFEAGSGPGIGDATITLNTGFFNGGTANLDGRIEVLDQTVTITNGTATLPTGENVVLTFEPNRVGDFAAALEVTISSGPGMGTINGEQAYVFGFETNPAEIAAVTSGTTVYSGDFQAFGSLDGALNSDTEYEGAITVEVDFSGSGNADVTLDGQLDSATAVDLSANNIPISGNGFAGTIGCASGCTGNGSSIDATFYGPNAAEVGGVLAIDVNVGGDDFDGVGTFVIGQGTP